MPQFVLFNPTVWPTTADRALAPRQGTLGGKTVGLLWNAKPRADVYLARVREILAERYPGVRFVESAKRFASEAMAPEVFEELSVCDVVVTALAY